MRIAIVAAAAAVLALGSCSLGEAADAGESPPPPSDTSPIPDAEVYAAEGIAVASACELLGVADVEIAAGGLGWGVVTEDAAECVYQDPDATHTVRLTVASEGQWVIAKGYEGAAGVDAGASGMVGFASGETFAALWAPAGATGAVVLSQSPANLTADAMIGLVETAAIAFENAPREP